MRQHAGVLAVFVVATDKNKTDVYARRITTGGGKAAVVAAQ